MKNDIRQRPTKVGGYNFSTQSARRQRRRSEAEQRAAGVNTFGSGIREQIANAGTVTEIKEALSLGGTYQFASSKTVRRWERAAQLRTNQLRLNQPI